jgi:predicted NAD/FAD-binding protein
MTRRDLARLLLLSAALPGRLAGAALPRRRVGIVGGGMAGVALAWLLDGERDVVLLEARHTLGGNVRSETVTLDGATFVVDVGAQYFHPGPYPLYSALLRRLGLFDPDHPEAGSVHAFPASITLFDADQPTPRFVSPAVPGRAWPLLPTWNRAGVQAFATAFAAAKRRERDRGDWETTLGEWLPTLGLSPAQWEGMILPWAASLFSGRVDEARELSARGAMVFAAKAIPANPLAPILYYVLRHGMIEVLDRLAAGCATTRFVTGAAVETVERFDEAFLIRLRDGGTVLVDDLVLAASGPTTLRLLSGLPDTGAQRLALEGIAFYDTRIALHAEPTYAPARPALRSFLNCRLDGDTCEATMALGEVLADAPPDIAARVYKSWVTQRAEPPGAVLREASFRHMLPTAATIRAQEALRSLQGRDRIWIAGGYLHPYDGQETALRSALGVAIGLRLGTPRIADLSAAAEAADPAD